jgi:hypothetical protein
MHTSAPGLTIAARERGGWSPVVVMRTLLLRERTQDWLLDGEVLSRRCQPRVVVFQLLNLCEILCDKEMIECVNVASRAILRSGHSARNCCF